MERRRAALCIASACRRRISTTACSSSGRTVFRTPARRSQIPEDQLCLDGICIPDIVNQLGFGFATNSYSKTGLAILEGKADILDLVNIYAAQKGAPSKVYLVGASEGGIITALSLEQSPSVFSAGLAACGPLGNFPYQINYFGDARATFEYFFPGVDSRRCSIPIPRSSPTGALTTTPTSNRSCSIRRIAANSISG